MKRLIDAWMVLGLVASAVLAQRCDLSRVETGWLCEKERRVLGPDEIVRKPGGVRCPGCARAPLTIDVCVKQAWTCSCRGATSTPGTCPRCGRERKPVTTRARVRHECHDCRTSSDEPGHCETPDCRSRGRLRRPVCDRSGFPPHGGRNGTAVAHPTGAPRSVSRGPAGRHGCWPADQVTRRRETR